METINFPMTETNYNGILNMLDDEDATYESLNAALATLLTLPDTPEALIQRALDLIHQAEIALKPPKVPFSQCAEEWLNEKRATKKSSTVRIYKQYLKHHIMPAFGERFIGDITRQEIVDFQAALVDKELKANFIVGIMRALKQIFRTAAVNEQIVRDPAEYVQTISEQKSSAKETIHRVLPKEIEDAFMEEVEKDPLCDFIALCKAAGLRQGEASALMPEDIDENFIHVNRTLMTDENDHVVMGDSPKTESSRRDIPINNKIREILNRQDMTDGESTIFKSVRGNYVSNAAVNRAIDKAIDRLKERGINIAHFSSHAFRHAFATRYVEAHRSEGGDMHTLKDIMGHSTYKLTADLYAHVLDTSKVAGMARMDEV